MWNKSRRGVVTDASPDGIEVLIHRVGSQWYIVEAFEAPVQPHQATALEIEFNKPGRVRSPLSIANLEPKAARRASAHQVR